MRRKEGAGGTAANGQPLPSSGTAYAERAGFAERAAEAAHATEATRAEWSQEASHSAGSDFATQAKESDFAQTAADLTASSPVWGKLLRKDQDDSTPFRLGVGSIGSNDFAEGLTGYGWEVDTEGNSEMNSLKLRSFLDVPEIRFNKVSAVGGILWGAPGQGIVERILTSDASGGSFLLKLEEGEIGEVAVGDLCIGMFHNLTGNATADTDTGNGVFTRAGFSTAYFIIKDIIDSPNGKNSHVFYQSVTVGGQSARPQPGLKFVAVGNETNTARQQSFYITRNYMRFLRGVTSFYFNKGNIAAQFGELTNLAGFGLQMAGYSAYIDNVYFRGVLQQLQEAPMQLTLDTSNSPFVASGMDCTVKPRLVKGVDVVQNTQATWRVARDGAEITKALGADGNFLFTHSDLGGSASSEFTIRADFGSDSAIASVILRDYSTVKGIDGAPGKDGINGEKGEKGDTGEKGDPGKDGTNGTNGTNGTPGKDGKSPKFLKINPLENYTKEFWETLPTNNSKYWKNIDPSCEIAVGDNVFVPGLMNWGGGNGIGTQCFITGTIVTVYGPKDCVVDHTGGSLIYTNGNGFKTVKSSTPYVYTEAEWKEYSSRIKLWQNVTNKTEMANGDTVSINGTLTYGEGKEVPCTLTGVVVGVYGAGSIGSMDVDGRQGSLVYSKPGKDGAPGKDGEKGEKGDTGEKGEDGKDGAPGKDGNSVVTVLSGVSKTLEAWKTLAAHTRTLWGVPPGIAKEIKIGDTLVINGVVSDYNNAACQLTGIYTEHSLQVSADTGYEGVYVDHTRGAFLFGEPGESVTGPAGAVMRGPVLWSADTPYFDGKEPEAGDTRFLDVVYVKDNEGANVFYTCKQSHTSMLLNRPPSAFWERMSNINALYASTLFAENARIEFGSAQEIVISKTDGTVTGRLGTGATPFWMGGASSSAATFALSASGEARFGNVSGRHVELKPEIGGSNGGGMVIKNGGTELAEYSGRNFEDNTIYTDVSQHFAQHSTYTRNTYSHAHDFRDQVVEEAEFEEIAEFTVDEDEGTCTDIVIDTVPYVSQRRVSLEGTDDYIGDEQEYVECKTVIEAIVESEDGAPVAETEIDSENEDSVLRFSLSNLQQGIYRVKVRHVYIFEPIDIMTDYTDLDTVYYKAEVPSCSIRVTYERFRAKYFANGLSLGSSTNDYFTAIHTPEKGVRFMVENKNGYGLMLTDNGFFRKTRGGGFLREPELLLRMGFNRRAQQVYKYASIDGFFPTVSYRGDRYYTFKFPRRWLEYIPDWQFTSAYMRISVRGEWGPELIWSLQDLSPESMTLAVSSTTHAPYPGNVFVEVYWLGASGEAPAAANLEED